MAVFQSIPSQIFDKVLSMPLVLNIQRLWIAQECEYVSGSEYARVLNIPGFWVCLWFWKVRIVNIPEFWICQGYTGFRIHMNNYWICLNMPDYVWICMNMPEYAGICVNMPKYAWMTFALHFSISPSAFTTFSTWTPGGRWGLWILI